jgi:CspA family cold shock protein
MINLDIKEGGIKMSKGIIKWFNNEKGYGFINGDVNEDIFVHYTAIKIDGYRTLSEGQEVTYQLIKTDKGLQATNVIPVNNSKLVAAF